MLNTKLTTDAFFELRELVEKLKPIYRSCLNCEYFDEKNEYCKMYSAKPPARVIAYACDSWLDVQPPF